MSWFEDFEEIDHGSDRARRLEPEEDEILSQAGELPPDVISELQADESEVDPNEIDYDMLPVGSERSHGIIARAHHGAGESIEIDLSGHDLGVIGEQSIEILRDYRKIDLSDNKLGDFKR